MSDGGVVQSVFGAGGVVAGAAALVAVVLRVRLRARILAQGVTARARCLETYLTVETRGAGTERRTSTERHVIMGFTTPDGRDVRFRDRSGVPRVTGDLVRVRYLPERPRRVVFADGHPSGVSGRLVAGAVGGLVLVAAGAVLAVLGLTAAPDAAAPGPLTSPAGQSPGPGWTPGGHPGVIVCTGGADGASCPDGMLASLLPKH
ncbi:DUF3592 domain-containing protein [Kitasatospora sp. NPDC056446]|uniref:DUF3592 domain-containing protein n=1 Tax=Kitasatospora sp. NPDC056446 TaxID=3345819 RepID=UPI0036A38369